MVSPASRITKREWHSGFRLIPFRSGRKPLAQEISGFDSRLGQFKLARRRNRPDFVCVVRP
jgi:hypothetical protein